VTQRQHSTIPQTPTIKLSWSSDDNRGHARNTSESTPNGQARVVPIPRSDSNDCTGPTCRLLAYRLRETIDYTVSPCDDFYKHVCGKYRGYSTFADVQRDLDLSIRSYLLKSRIPKSNQLSWQKAAAMYHACISYTSSYEPETKYLVRWMVSLNLDLLNETRLMNVDPVEMMVRGSLDFGVEAILSVVLEENQFKDGKRVVTVDHSNKLKQWRSHNRDVEEYYPFVTMYGAKPPFDKQLALKIQRYENR
ncbi:hypothetical protein MRX96_046169, partial [Rhipicephalus microplus]